MLRKALKVLTLLSLALVAWVTAFSFVDGPPVDDSDLSIELPPLADEENGYVELLALSDNEELADKLADVAHHLEQNIVDTGCRTPANDPALVEELQDVLNASAAKPRFRQPRMNSLAQEHPQYRHWVWAGRILLQGSLCSALDGDTPSTLRYLQAINDLISHMAVDMNINLLSYAVVISLRNDLVLVVHALAQAIPPARRKLLDILEEVPLLGEETFFRALGGEYVFVKGVATESVGGTLPERFDRLSTNHRNCLEYSTPEECAEGRVFEYAVALLPGYYFQRNTTLSAFRRDYLEVASRASSGCQNMMSSSVESRWPESGPALKYLLLPNGRGRYYVDTGAIPGLLPPYFGRACISTAYLEGVKVVIALELFKTEYGDYPEELSMLLPEYLRNSPRDPYSDAHLQYDRERYWLYSLGDDGHDDGGSSRAIFHRRCWEDERCYNNLTIPFLGEDADSVVRGSYPVPQ